MTLLRERAPHVGVEWCETAVQGPNAAADIVSAIGRASRADVDLIVVTRGGGSFEDLFVFSDERVVRAVARARHPVISAIGHTADQQLCDFAADEHVETPSAAAEAVGFARHVLLQQIGDARERARRSAALRVERLAARLDAALLRSKLAQPQAFLVPLAQRLGDAGEALDAAASVAMRRRDERVRALGRRLDARDPSRRLEERARRLQAAVLRLGPALTRRLERAGRERGELAARLDSASRAQFERKRQSLALGVAHLDGKNPEAILQRGYAIVTYAEAIVCDPRDVPTGALVAARLARGTLSARVERDGVERDGARDGAGRKETDGNQRIG